MIALPSSMQTSFTGALTPNKQTPYRRPPDHAPWNLQTASANPQPVCRQLQCKRGLPVGAPVGTQPVKRRSLPCSRSSLPSPPKAATRGQRFSTRSRKDSIKTQARRPPHARPHSPSQTCRLQLNHPYIASRSAHFRSSSTRAQNYIGSTI